MDTEHRSYLDEFNNLDVAGYVVLHPELFTYVKEAMAQPGKQYLLVGDTNHNSIPLKNFLTGAPLAALFRHAAIPHVAVETKRELLEPQYLEMFRSRCRMYHSGQITREQMEKDRDWLFDRGDAGAPNNKRTLLGYAQAGLRMTPADSRQWHNEGVHRDAERLFLGDREVAHYIARRARGEKTGIVYGAGHFYYSDAMASRLGRDKCVHVDIYPDRATYQKLRTDFRLHVDTAPDKVYILDERCLEDADMSLYRRVERDNDPMQNERLEVAYLYNPCPQTMAQMTAVGTHLIPQPGFDPKWFTYVPTS